MRLNAQVRGKHLIPDTWNPSCHISTQRTPQSSAIAAAAGGEMVSTEEMNSGRENAGCWPQRGEARIKGMMSASPDSGVLPSDESIKSLT